MDKIESSSTSNTFSRIVIIITACVALYTVISDKFWKINYVIKADMNGYYEYLPAVFIYHDLDLKFTDSISKQYEGMYLYEISPTDKRFIKYTCGVSYLVAPFFIATKLICQLFNKPGTGYSDPFEIAVILSGIFYLIAGMIFLKKVLRGFFSDKTTALSLFCIALGTNLFFYSTTQPLMAHVYSFFASAVFLHFLIKWNFKTNILNSSFVGLTIGLLVLLRPVNILFVLVFLLYDFKSLSQFKIRIKLHVYSIKYLLIITVCAFLVWIPQLYYWHYVSGNWFFFSYQNESFYFSHPYILKGLFSFRNGWLIYSPIMILIFPGIYFLLKSAKQFFIPIVTFTPLFIFIVLSWWCWWYVGFGNRAFIDAYALFSLPIAAALERILSSKLIPKIIGLTVICFLCYLNQFQNWQMKYGILHYDSMTANAYQAVFLKKTLPDGFQYLLKTPDYDGAKFQGKESAH